MSLLYTQRWGYVPLLLSADISVPVAVCPIHFCPACNRVAKRPFVPLVNQVYTSFSLVSLRSPLPVTALPKGGRSTLVK